MKTKKEKEPTADKSTRQNSMAPGGKSPAPKKAADVGPEEFEEDQSMKLRMKEQPLKKK